MLRCEDPVAMKYKSRLSCLTRLGRQTCAGASECLESWVLASGAAFRTKGLDDFFRAVSVQRHEKVTLDDGYREPSCKRLLARVSAHTLQGSAKLFIGEFGTVDHVVLHAMILLLTSAGLAVQAKTTARVGIIEVGVDGWLHVSLPALHTPLLERMVSNPSVSRMPRSSRNFRVLAWSAQVIMSPGW